LARRVPVISTSSIQTTSVPSMPAGLEKRIVVPVDM